jgi:glucose/arabinose dehydrogenase
MKRLLGVIVVFGCGFSTAAAADPLPMPLVTGLKFPTSMAFGADGRIYVAEAGEGGKDGLRIVVINDGKVVPFATGLNLPMGLTAFHEFLFVADLSRVCRIDKKGKVEEYIGKKDFPDEFDFLCAITVDEQGTFYVSAAGGLTGGSKSAIFRVDVKKKVTLVVANKTESPITPTAMTMDGMSFLLFGGLGTKSLHRMKIPQPTAQKLTDDFLSGGQGFPASGMVWDHYGRLYASDWEAGKVFVIPRPGQKPVVLASGFEAPVALALDPNGKSILVVDNRAGTITALPTKVPGQDIDQTPLSMDTAPAFPDLKWTGWNPDNKGKPNPLRPIVLTHAGDGSNRVFVATEHGVIHVFPNDQKATETKIFLDLQDRVVYDDKQNEEGFLGLAFHPDYKKNGELFVFYTTKKAKLTNVISRFRVSKDDPNKADPDSEEVLLKIEKPYWNHDGGTLCFGPDGYLYFTHGDGGLANDPHKNGQNLKSLLGKVHRIDVDHKDPGKNYAIPKDNPFVDRKDALPEIWAYGLRNIWRMSFDKKTGVLWAGDVGQNLYEEIDLITKGGNYGWSVREGLHPFGPDGSDVRKDLIDPIWEYHHDLGKCIIGGHVYRGSRVPELEGSYVYGDYVTGQLWALRYDKDKGRVVANRTIREKGTPMLSFGEDEKGEVYLLQETLTGKGIQWFVRPKEGK